MSFIGWVVGLAVVGALLALSLWILYYHYRNRRLGLSNQPFFPPLPRLWKKKTSRGTSNRGGSAADLENEGRPYEGLGGDEAWDAREDFEGTRPLHSVARGFDGQNDRRQYGDDDLENPFGEGATRTKTENPFGSGARRVDDGQTADIGSKGPSPPQGSRRSLFNEDI
jgi:hypothetical protein